jgi:hypothetical protein
MYVTVSPFQSVVVTTTKNVIHGDSKEKVSNLGGDSIYHVRKNSHEHVSDSKNCTLWAIGSIVKQTAKEANHTVCKNFLINKSPMGNTFHYHLLQLLGSMTATKEPYFYPNSKSGLPE